MARKRSSSSSSAMSSSAIAATRGEGFVSSIANALRRTDVDREASAFRMPGRYFSEGLRRA
jgi:hypothetical protein